MSISMSGATVDQSSRDALLASTVDGGSTGGVTANTKGGFFGHGGTASGASLAGVTAEFAAQVSSAIDDYCANVESKLNELNAVESNGAFRGGALTAALSSFITGVKEVSMNYLAKLKEAEQQIVASVGAAYEAQDADLAGNLNSDVGTIS